MSQSELLKKTIAALEAAGTPYMLTGSFASSLQGEPRLTHDIDLVVAITLAGIKALLSAFPAPDYYLDEIAIARAVAQKSQFNLLDVVGGDKVDFWLLTDDPFDQSRFAPASGNVRRVSALYFVPRGHNFDETSLGEVVWRKREAVRGRAERLRITKGIARFGICTTLGDVVGCVRSLGKAQTRGQKRRLAKADKYFSDPDGYLWKAA